MFSLIRTVVIAIDEVVDAHIPVVHAITTLATVLACGARGVVVAYRRALVGRINARVVRVAKEISTDIATDESISSVKDARAIIVRRTIDVTTLSREKKIVPPLIWVFSARRISRVYDEVNAAISRTAHGVFERIRTSGQVKVDAHVVYHHRWKVATGAVPSASISSTGSTRLGGIREEGRDPIHVFRRFGRRTGASDCIRRVRGQKFISRLHEEVLDISHVKIFIVVLALRRISRRASVPWRSPSARSRGLRHR